MTRMLKYLRAHHLGLIALFIALGGTSYAATSIPRNSVSTPQIKANAINGSKIKNETLGAEKLTAAARETLKGNAGATGPQGGTGERGPQGERGPAGERGPTGPTEQLSARVFRGSGSTQTIPNSTNPPPPGGPGGTGAGGANTPLTFTSEVYDFGDFFDATRPSPAPPNPAGAGFLRIPKTGTYYVDAGVRWAANPNGVRSLAILSDREPGTLGLRVNNVMPAAPAPPSPCSGTSCGITVQNVSTTDRFQAGDIVFASAGQNSGGDLNVVGSQSQVHLSAAYVGP